MQKMIERNKFVRGNCTRSYIIFNLINPSEYSLVKGLIIAKVPERILSGKIEIAVSKNFADKTNWRKMLKGEYEDLDLFEFRERAHKLFPEELRCYALENEKVQNLVYPVESVPEKITSHNLDKIPEFEDRLTGIKGQYLIFETRVINMRKYSGYHIDFNFD